LRPKLIEIPIPFIEAKIPVFGYGLMLIIGVIVATALAARAGKRRGILPEKIWDFGVYVVLFGILGARAQFFIEYHQESFAGKPLYTIFYIWEGGLVLYGGVAAGVVAGYIYLKRQRIPIADFLDTIGPYAPIGLGFGRLGCLLNGCCWGHLTGPDFPLGIRFPAGSLVSHAQDQFDLTSGVASLPVQPTQIYAALHAFLLFGLLIWYVSGTVPRGSVFPVMGILYGIGRFVEEIIRDDVEPFWLGLTLAQWTSAGVFVVSILFLGKILRPYTPPATFPAGSGAAAKG